MSIERMSTDELYSRVGLGRRLREDLKRDEGPQAEAASLILLQQIRQLEEEIARREGKPAPVVIGLQTGSISALRG